MLNRTTIDDDRVVLASVARGARGSRWCELDLEPGAVLVYGPGAEHTAINRPGLDFRFVTAAPGRLEAIAEELSSSIEVPERGSVERLRPSSATSSLLGAFLEFRGAAARGTDRTGRPAAEVLPAIAMFLSRATEDWRKPTPRPIDRRRVVFKAIDYAEAIGRVPSLGELCALTHVSPRSLRRAFTSEFDVPPTQFFRTWALGKAHSRLRDADDGAAARLRDWPKPDPDHPEPGPPRVPHRAGGTQLWGVPLRRRSPRAHGLLSCRQGA